MTNSTANLSSGRFVGPIEGDLDLKLLSAPHDEEVAGVQVRVGPCLLIS